MTETEARLQAIDLSRAAFQQELDWDEAHRKAQELIAPFLDHENCESETVATYGALLSDVGRHAQAFEVLNKLVTERSPSFSEAHFNLAVCMMNLEQHRPYAKEHFLRAGNLDSSDTTLQAYFDLHAH